MDQKEHTDDWDSSEDEHISLDELSKLLIDEDEDDYDPQDYGDLDFSDHDHDRYND